MRQSRNVIGDIDGFVRTGLKLTDEEIRKLREMYLDV
ncbi:MAG: tyrosine-protein phosphatase [Lachnospiraceae bacterium]|nr:tyrosine-protein phosphatase [Lachnospiraceae bacterium]